MGWLRTLLSATILFGTVAVGGLFALQNTTPVPLDLLVLQLPERTISLWLLLALALGVILGLLSGLVVILSLRARLAAATRQRDRLTLEVDRLRKVGLSNGE